MGKLEGTSSISIIGLGNMASALAMRALAGGHTVEIVGRDRSKAQELAAALGGATVGTFGAAPLGDIVVLAVPYGAVLDVVKHHGQELAGKLLVDITNPINSDFTGFLNPEASSGAQEIAKIAPAGTPIVKAFNTLNSRVLTDGPVGGHPLDVFLAGDDAQAKKSVAAFIESPGIRPIDVGGLPMAKTLEHACMLWLGLMTHSVHHPNFSIGISVLD